jgi:prophage regulatory protein
VLLPNPGAFTNMLSTITSVPTPRPPIDRILRSPAVTEAIGLSRATMYRLIDAGDFPSPVRLGPNSVGWRESAVSNWIAERKDTLH